ncbi:hypothetical protein TRIP_E160111 [uncultured Spirochaetota bacterium]|nr:hypothetical protein TRIP_E160111 [uncultured Spirochaetota bacterium]
MMIRVVGNLAGTGAQGPVPAPQSNKRYYLIYFTNN